MNLSKSIDFLLKNACVNIRYLINRDVLKIDVSDKHMQQMQEEILRQPSVQKHFSAQHTDGWFGIELHGNDGMDGHIGALLRLGVEPTDVHIQNAVKALLTPEISSKHKNCFRGGDALDTDGRGGNRAVIAEILVQAHADEKIPILADEITLAFDHLSAALSYKNVDDLSIANKNVRYYKPHIKFPGANHIYLLAATKSWQTEEKLHIAKKAITHCYHLMKDANEEITFRKPKELGGGFVGPFNFNWKVLNAVDITGLQQIIDNRYHFAFGFWLRTLIALPEWAVQSNQTYELLAEISDSDKLIDMIPEKTLKGFRQVCGIEPRWNNKTAVKCDLVFSVLKVCLTVSNGAV
jgi:hypothetical protein